MKTLFLDPHFKFVRTPLAPTKRTPEGAAAFSVRRAWPRPYFKFTTPLPMEDRALMESLSGFIDYHQGDIPFLCDCGDYGDIQTPILIGFGNGSDTDFFVPRANLIGSSWIFYVNGVVDPLWTMNEASGRISFSTAPANGAEIIGKGRCRYKCLFWTQSEEELPSAAQIQASIWEFGELVLREIP